MTDESRAELRRGLTAVVRAAAVEGAWVPCVDVDVPTASDRQQWWSNAVRVEYPSAARNYRAHFDGPPNPPRPPLTDVQQLALSVLLGDPRVSAAVLIGALEDSGVWAAGAVTEMAERVRAEERERVVKWISHAADQRPDSGWVYRVLAELVAAGVQPAPHPLISDAFGRAVYRLHNTADQP